MFKFIAFPTKYVTLFVLAVTSIVAIGCASSKRVQLDYVSNNIPVSEFEEAPAPRKKSVRQRLKDSASRRNESRVAGGH